MGRRRKDGDPLGLAGTRIRVRGGRFYYIHPGPPVREEPLGTDLVAAKKRAALYNDPAGAYGTVGYWLEAWLAHCAGRVNAGSLSARTLADYTAALPPLQAFFGHLAPEQVEPAMVQQYVDAGAALGRPVPANRERAALSAMLSWLLRQPGAAPALRINPCMRASGVRRNTERQRERYVTHAEYRATYAAAGPSVRLMMELVYRTLQRPEVDVLAWTPAIVRTKGTGAGSSSSSSSPAGSSERVLRFRQSKTGRQIDIALVGRLDELVRQAIGDVPVLHQPLVHTLAGHGYSYDGISAMLKRAQKAAGVASFGFRDLKGKGATDMWLAGEPIERIQLLCGHAHAATTERYIKARWTETAQPNLLEIG